MIATNSPTSAAEAIAKNPGGTAFNPLFIFGDVGLGKTHLAQAIGNAVVNTRDDKTVLYVSSEKFTNQIIEAIKNNAVGDFTNFYQLVNLLIIDDIQFLAGKQRHRKFSSTSLINCIRAVIKSSSLPIALQKICRGWKSD